MHNISATPIGIGIGVLYDIFAYYLDYVDRHTDCKSHDMWSTPISVARCDYAEISRSVSLVKPFLPENSNDDIIIGFSYSIHSAIGFHYSLGINLSEFKTALSTIFND